MPHVVSLTLLVSLALSCPTHAGEVPHLHLDTEVSAASVGLLELELSAAIESKAPAILLEIDSPGGEVDSGFRLVKAIEASPVPVICVVDGQAASMASYILEACTYRVMTKRSKLMFHEPAMGGEFQGQQTKWQSIADWLRAETLALAEHVCHRSKVKPETMLEKIRSGAMWWLSWKEAAEDGFVDGVVDSVSDVQVVQASK